MSLRYNFLNRAILQCVCSQSYSSALFRSPDASLCANLPDSDLMEYASEVNHTALFLSCCCYTVANVYNDPLWRWNSSIFITGTAAVSSRTGWFWDTETICLVVFLWKNQDKKRKKSNSYKTTMVASLHRKMLSVYLSLAIFMSFSGKSVITMWPSEVISFLFPQWFSRYSDSRCT